MTFKAILHLIKNMSLYIDIIHRNFYQNQFINEWASQKKAKISESQIFLVRYRRTYILNRSMSSSIFYLLFAMYCCNLY